MPKTSQLPYPLIALTLLLSTSFALQAEPQTLAETTQNYRQLADNNNAVREHRQPVPRSKSIQKSDIRDSRTPTARNVNGTNTAEPNNNFDEKSFAEANRSVSPFKTWIFGTNTLLGGKQGFLDATLTHPKVKKPVIHSLYNLKNLERKRFLHYESHNSFLEKSMDKVTLKKQRDKLKRIPVLGPMYVAAKTGGEKLTAVGKWNKFFIGQIKPKSTMSLGWTDNATVKTGEKNAFWLIVPKNQGQPNSTDPTIRSEPIKYGETVGLSWGSVSHNYIHYAKRKRGINLKWSKRPVYEWVILGGKPGEFVKKGQDKVILYNLKHKEPLIYYPRKKGGRIGWPDTKSKRVKSIPFRPKLNPGHIFFQEMMLDDAKNF